MDLGPVGIWSWQLRYGEPSSIAEAAVELENLGFSALWIPGGAGGDILGDCERLLASTNAVVVASGILNIWMHDPAEVALAHNRLTTQHPNRFLLGLGISHRPLVESTNQRYERPLAAMERYLDQLDEASPPVPRSERVLAALGPRMLELAGERTAGAHPYLVVPEHTASARQTLGAGALLAPEQKVILDTDAAAARALAREQLGMYLQLPNYTNNLLRLGFSEDDFSGGGSDRLIDRIVAWGDLDTIADRVREHHQAGADHVCVQVLTADRSAPPVEVWRRLAPALCTR